MNRFSGKRPGIRIALSLLVLAGLAAAISPPPPPPQPIPCQWDGVERIVAVGDVHGDYENFVQILKEVGLLDEQLRWTGGKTHLVQTGDIMDRYTDAKETLDLMKRLEVEAPKTGGMVHLLLGNHEELNIAGLSFDYSGYMTIKQFLDFLPPAESRRARDRQIRRANISKEAFYRDVWRDQEWRTLYREGFNETYGRWLAEHNVVIKINGIVFVHGGISQEDSRRPLQEINDGYRRELRKIARGEMDFVPRYVFAGAKAPLWNRELSGLGAESSEEGAGQELASENLVDQILANLGASNIVIAHTPRLVWDDMNRFGGKIWIIDTGICRLYRGGHNSALLCENGKIEVFHADASKRKTERDLEGGILDHVIGGGPPGLRPAPPPGNR
jgi:hypothetical protein